MSDSSHRDTPSSRYLHTNATAHGSREAWAHVHDAGFHVSDCRVWAEIFYLDSPTDYREFLPNNEPAQHTWRNSGFVLSDESRRLPRYGPSFTTVAVLLFVLLLIVMYWADYL